MLEENFVVAALLGVVEGLTEFIPVSSTGHLIFLVDVLAFEGPRGKVFEIVIQLGAVLAVCWAYRAKLLAVILGFRSSPEAQHFAKIVLLGFLPAAIIGAAAHGFIMGVLFSPWVVSASLIMGGVAILGIERAVPVARVRKVDEIDIATALKIGVFQAVAMVPGVSRSGATIMGALLLRVDRKAAAEFSFFLAIPTMLGATAFDLFKNRATLDTSGGFLIAVGFVAAFLTALGVVRMVIGFIGRHGFTPFAWYRIGVGVLMLAALLAR